MSFFLFQHSKELRVVILCSETVNTSSTLMRPVPIVNLTVNSFAPRPTPLKTEVHRNSMRQPTQFFLRPNPIKRNRSFTTSLQYPTYSGWHQGIVIQLPLITPRWYQRGIMNKEVMIRLWWNQQDRRCTVNTLFASILYNF